MLTHIDHLLLATEDLAAAERDWRAAGFEVSGGGEHPGRGTANRIIVLDPEYLELIGVRDPALARPAMVRFLQSGPGAFNYALSSDDLEADATRLRTAGLALDPIYEGALVNPNGTRRGWHAASPQEQPGKRLPFLIQHDSAGEEKRRRLAAPDTLKAHPNLAQSLNRIYVAVHSLAGGLTTYGTLYGLHADQEVDGPFPATRSLLLPLPHGGIELVAPAGDDSPLHAILERRGEGIFGFALRAAIPGELNVQGVIVRGLQ